MKQFAVVVSQGGLAANMKFEAESIDALIAEFERMLREPTVIARKGEIHPDTAFVLISSPAMTFEVKGDWHEFLEQQKQLAAARQVVPASALVRPGMAPGLGLPVRRR